MFSIIPFTIIYSTFSIITLLFIISMYFYYKNNGENIEIDILDFFITIFIVIFWPLFWFMLIFNFIIKLVYGDN